MGLAGRGVPAVHDNAEKRDGWRFAPADCPNGHLGSAPAADARWAGPRVLAGPRASSRLAEAVANARGFLVSWACITTTRFYPRPLYVLAERAATELMDPSIYVEAVLDRNSVAVTAPGYGDDAE